MNKVNQLALRNIVKAVVISMFMQFKQQFLNQTIQFNMHQANRLREEKSLSFLIKNSKELVRQAGSRASLTPNFSNSSESFIDSSRERFHVKIIEGPPQPFTIQAGQGNLSTLLRCPLQPHATVNQQLKSAYLKRIADSVTQLRRALVIYRYLEKDEQKCKPIIFGWFRQVEGEFLHCLNDPVNPATAEALLQEQLRANSRRTAPTSQENLFPNSLNNQRQQMDRELNQLREQVEAFRKDSIESLQKLQSITEMMAELKSRLEEQRKMLEEEQAEKEILTSTLREIVKQADSIVDKIAAKQKAVGRVTLIEQITSQVLIKFKFKAYAESAI